MICWPPWWSPSQSTFDPRYLPQFKTPLVQLSNILQLDFMHCLACDAVEGLEIQLGVSQEHIAIDVVQWNDSARKYAGVVKQWFFTYTVDKTHIKAWFVLFFLDEFIYVLFQVIGCLFFGVVEELLEPVDEVLCLFVRRVYAYIGVFITNCNLNVIVVSKWLWWTLDWRLDGDDASHDKVDKLDEFVISWVCPLHRLSQHRVIFEFQ